MLSWKQFISSTYWKVNPLNFWVQTGFVLLMSRSRLLIASNIRQNLDFPFHLIEPPSSIRTDGEFIESWAISDFYLRGISQPLAYIENFSEQCILIFTTVQIPEVYLQGIWDNLKPTLNISGSVQSSQGRTDSLKPLICLSEFSHYTIYTFIELKIINQPVNRYRIYKFGSAVAQEQWWPKSENEPKSGNKIIYYWN